jgi:hypothetical protein
VEIRGHLLGELWREQDRDAAMEEAMFGDFQAGLEVMGMIPGGELADGFNAVIYIVRGQPGNALICVISILPAGDLAKGARRAVGNASDGWRIVAKLEPGANAATIYKSPITLGAGGELVVTPFAKEVVEEITGKVVPRGIITPSTRLQQWAQQGGYVDPRTNTWVKFDGNLAADQVYPKTLIKKLEGFDDLTPQQQEFLLNYPGNFEPLPKSWNSSKWNRLADDWAKNTPMGRQASKEYIDALRMRQQAFEEFAKSLIEFWNR